MKEQEIINLIRNTLPLDKNSHNLQDDIATLKLLNKNLIVSTDSIVQGWHLFDEVPAYYVGVKLMLRNISDISTKGAFPKVFTLSLFVPQDMESNHIVEFINGINHICNKYNIKLLGGDTVISSKITSFIANVNIFGEPEVEPLPLRQNAKASDIVCHYGIIGQAYNGYKNFKSNPEKVTRYLMPEVNTDINILIAKYANATIDISDGIVKDIKNLESASSITIKYDKEKINCGNLKDKYDIDELISFGDDYLPLFTITNQNLNKLKEEIKLQKYIHSITEFGCCFPI